MGFEDYIPVARIAAVVPTPEGNGWPTYEDKIYREQAVKMAAVVPNPEEFNWIARFRPIGKLFVESETGRVRDSVGYVLPEQEKRTAKESREIEKFFGRTVLNYGE